MPGYYLLVRFIFLRSIATIYLFAFYSIFIQIDGLIGSQGILPATQFLSYFQTKLPEDYWTKIPSIFWLDSSDTFLKSSCLVAILLSVILMIGVAEKLVSTLLLILHISFVAIGQTFFSYQWDALLIEVGFLTVLVAPLSLRPRILNAQSPNHWTIFLFRFLLFRLMFSSGMVKILSEDPSWESLTALNYHYLTQPLPTLLAWHIDKLPEIVHKTSAASMFIIELILPFLIFSGSKLRLFAASVFVSFQIAIILTGNYTYFNLLTITLCLFVLDDEHLRHFFPRKITDRLSDFRSKLAIKVKLLTLLITIPILVISSSQLLITFGAAKHIPDSLMRVIQQLEPYRIINRYGLFAVMTTERHEIIIEGTKDGTNWSEYHFKYKPGDIMRPPSTNIPHQPRLDWQMWFAALSAPERSQWLLRFGEGLLKGNRTIIELLQSNPFPESPPKAIRFMFYKYRFSTGEEKAATGAWWQRELLGVYLGPIELKTTREQ